MPIRCIIADDEPLACRLLTSYVERTPSLELIGAYTSASEALEAINRDRPDLALLDIQMPEISGLDIARRIPQSCRVVFTTAYRDYAVEGFRVNALDYLLKPISYDEFLEAISRAEPRQTEDSACLTVRSEYRLIRIRIDDILFVEGLKDYVKIHVDGRPRPVLTRMSMKSIEATLPSDRFMRVHRSYIANISRIRMIERGQIVYDRARIPVSDSYRAALIEHLS